jgi:hypothetical protein
MNATHAVPITTIPTLPETIAFDGLSRLVSVQTTCRSQPVDPKQASRIRSVLRRLPSLDDVTEMRTLANAEARAARHSGNEERAEYYLAIASEAESILEAAICQGEAPRPAAAA